MRRLIVLLLMLCVWGSSGRRTERNIVCRNGTGYVHNGICCLNCPAGMFVKEPCSNELTMGLCQHCEFDTYTEYDNGIFPSCLKCTKCRPDQELVEQCSSTRNTRCQCKAGTFCLPDQACEICKTCRKCKEDEKMVNSCTAFSNTVCDKRGSVPGNTSTAAVVVSVMAIVMMVIIVGVFLFWRKSSDCKKTVASRWLERIWKTSLENSNDLVEAMEVNRNTVNSQLSQCSTHLVCVQTTEDDEDKGLGPSLSNTTASSQTSLSSEPRLNHLVLQQLNALKNEDLPKVVPINGDDSLRKSFYLFAEIDVTFHNRFFRYIGLSDNTIRTTDMSYSSPEDKVYELLKTWMEKEGMKADFNSLIKALINLNQKLSAENITAKAIEHGYFRYED